VGSSPIIHISFLKKGRLAEWIQAMDCKPIYTGSIPVATSKFAEVVQQADTAHLKRAFFESSNLSFGMQCESVV
jgi:hypothetical protein